MRFKASNNRTYNIEYPFSKGIEGYNRFGLKIIEGDAILSKFDGDHDLNEPIIAIAPFLDPKSGIVDWDNPFYGRSFIDDFVPDDLKRFCERIVKNLILL